MPEIISYVVGLSNFKVAENYNEVQVKADTIEKELFKLNNNILLLQNTIDNISKSLELSPDITKKNITNIYNESKIYFSENTSKALDDLENFYEKLISNRRRRLLEQQNKLKLEQQNQKIVAARL